MSWHTGSPDLTDCFKHTVLRLVPPGWFLVAFLCGLPFLRPQRPPHLALIGFSALQVAKILLAAAFALVSLFDAVYIIITYNQLEFPSPILIASPFIEFFILVLYAY